MGTERGTGLVSLLAFGAAAFLVACLSILDMFLPRPYDGVVLDLDAAEPVVLRVEPGSGAREAGLEPGDRIAGVGRTIVRTPADAARVLGRHSIGETVDYLVERNGRLLERHVRLGTRTLGAGWYLYACVSGFLFFFIGLYVLLQRPDSSAGAPSRVFFALCTLFLLFLVCRLRPASYSWVDEVVLTTGTLSLLVLPAAFLHFFLVFPRRLTIHLVDPNEGWEGLAGRAIVRVERFINNPAALIRTLYLLPPLLFVATFMVGRVLGVRFRLVSGAPISSWVLMGDYLVLGLLALLVSLVRAEEGRERRQIATVFAGTVAGVTPFLVLGVAMPSMLRTDEYLYWGVVPLILVPLTFAYAIVRFHFFDIRVIVRRSVLYTMTTAVVGTGYAVGIAAFNLLFRDSSIGRSPYFFLIFALVIVGLFDPLRRRLQEPVDRFFFREVYDARRAMEEVSETVVRELSFEKLERLLTVRLAEIMHLEWAALYRREGRSFTAGSASEAVPRELEADLLVIGELARQEAPVRPVDLEPLKPLDPRSRQALDALVGAGARVLAPLRSRERLHAVLVLGPKLSGEEYGRDDVQVVRTLANQAAVALENAELLKERTRQLELEKELEIARRVQFALIPTELPQPPGWEVAARCVPARQVGGDFYDALPTGEEASLAYVLGDVSGKSVPGAMLMVAAREVLQTAALGGASPRELLGVANQRLYAPRHRLFVALTYLRLGRDGEVTYALAGQPGPLCRRATGRVDELATPSLRLPVGALRDAGWDLVTQRLEEGDLLVAFSDGLTDARNRHGELFGDERLQRVLSRLDGSAATCLEGLLAEVDAFVDGDEPYDDITLLVARWHGQRPEGRERGIDA
ncbi:MAG TPA: SpoIIE family protein phosphatase [Thermoanaerobaculaceae bacterium]|nr:SpoIIE family protein phosphatase [Thermoanaerobaculaceae bacterium]HRS15824.1 SpoIIE family protein phosphatase [Thermoanaerobaculaceae bacterium]